MKKTFQIALVAIFCAATSFAHADFTEGFDVVVPLPTGWAQQNLSFTPSTGYFQGNPAVFAAQAGATNAYAGVNFQSIGAGAGQISNWLFAPQTNMNNGDTFSFWTRTVDTVNFPDRLEVRLSTNGASVDAGATTTSVGDFTTLLATINPGLTTTGYPSVWTQFTITLSGLSGPSNGRFAFRYEVPDGGPAGANSDYIGIDTVQFLQAIPEPSSAIAIACAGTFACLIRRRRVA